MQADEMLYPHPDRTRPFGRAMDVDAGPLPDVVLEVDHTTGVRRRKLGAYRVEPVLRREARAAEAGPMVALDAGEQRELLPRLRVI